MAKFLTPMGTVMEPETAFTKHQHHVQPKIACTFTLQKLKGREPEWSNPHIENGKFPKILIQTVKGNV